jgi:hypothetical protein
MIIATRLYLVKISARINRTVLDDVVDNVGQRVSVVRIGELGMEEDLGPQEPLVAHVHREQLLRDAIDAVVLLQPLARLPVVLGELLDNVGTDVAELLLDRLGRLQRLLGRYAALALLQQALHEVGDVTARDGYVLDAGADHVAVRHRYDVGDAVAAVHHHAGEGALVDLPAGPRGR